MAVDSRSYAAGVLAALCVERAFERRRLGVFIENVPPINPDVFVEEVGRLVPRPVRVALLGSKARPRAAANVKVTTDPNEANEWRNDARAREGTPGIFVVQMLAPALVNSMTAAADSAIRNVLLRGSLGQLPPRTEVGFVAAVTLGGVNAIAAEWRQILRPSGCTLGLTGVFCHGAPLVRFKVSKALASTCELADLLIVVDRERAGGVARRACLIQAKMAGKLGRVFLTGRSSIRQLTLYQSWPPFRFVNDATYGTHTYNCQNGRLDTAMFGVIDRHLQNELSPIWTQHRVTPTPDIVRREPELGGFIANMAVGPQPGFGRLARPGGKDDWSKVVDLLLKVTYSKAFRHQSTLGAMPHPRGVSAVACLVASASDRVLGRWPAGGWKPPYDGFETSDDDSPGGISLLHLRIARERGSAG